MEYSGFYGPGHKDEKGDLYLHLNPTLSILRSKNEDGTYDVFLLDEVKKGGISVLEHISLSEWRKFFLNPEIENLIKELEESEDRIWDDC